MSSSFTLSPFRSSRRICRLVGWLGLAAALVWFIIAAFCFHRAQEKAATWLPVTALVTELEPVHSESLNEELFRAHFLFTASDGKEYRVKDTLRSNPPSYAPGEKVKLIYPPAAPAEAIRETATSLYLLPAILGYTSIMHFVVALGLLFIGGRKKEA